MVSDACHWACILQVMYDNIVIISSMLSFVAECRTNCAVISLATIQDSGLLMNFCRPSKSIWSSLFKTWHWLQDKIASLSWGMTIFFGLFYIHLKGVFFFISGLLWTKCYQRLVFRTVNMFKITWYKMFMKYKVQQPKNSTCRATSDVYTMFLLLGLAMAM